MRVNIYGQSVCVAHSNNILRTHISGTEYTSISSLKYTFIHTVRIEYRQKRTDKKKYSKPIYNNQYLIYPKINNVLLYLDRVADKTLFTQFFRDTEKKIRNPNNNNTLQNDAACFYLPFTYSYIKCYYPDVSLCRILFYPLPTL